MRSAILAASLILAMLHAAPRAEARTVCTLVAEAVSGRVLHETGDCDRRVTPASTFKVALAVMGFEAGILTGPHAPVMEHRAGDPTWGGDAWKQPTDPAHWMRHSVVWYSQRIARALGVAGLEQMARAWEYGNADFSGDPGADNGVERAWIASSLLISPREQAAFLGRLTTGRLPVSARAADMAMSIVRTHAVPEGWMVAGKTGSAYRRLPDGRIDRSQSLGWFVGWAVKGETHLVFARLEEWETRQQGSPGRRVRDGLLADWPALVGAAGGS